MPLVRSTSWISPTSAPSATPFGPFSAARWTRSRSSTPRSRSSSFPAPRVFARIRCPPRGESPGRTPTAATRTSQPARHASPSAADADDASGPGGGPMAPLESAAMGSKRRRSSRHRATARSTPTPPTRPSCRASSAPGAMPRDRSFAGCISACRAAGGRRLGDDASTFDARCAPAFRPAARRCRRVGCAAHGGRRDSCCWSTAAAR